MLNFQYSLLISNGIGVLKHRIGDIIDSFSMVVRMNHFRLNDDSRPYIGQKTDLWIHNGLEHIDPRPIEDVKKIIVMSNRDWIHKSKYNLIDLTQIYHIGKYVSILNAINSDHPYRDYSVGLFSMVYLNDVQGPVYCYGFDGLTTNGHYFNKQHTVATCHNPTIENKIRSYLKGAGMVIDLEDVL